MILKSLLHVGKLALERRLEEEADGHLSGASSCLLSNRPVLGPPTKEQNDALFVCKKKRNRHICSIYDNGKEMRHLLVVERCQRAILGFAALAIGMMDLIKHKKGAQNEPIDNSAGCGFDNM